jgi:hypothetical protein
MSAISDRELRSQQRQMQQSRAVNAAPAAPATAPIRPQAAAQSHDQALQQLADHQVQGLQGVPPVAAAAAAAPHVHPQAQQAHQPAVHDPAGHDPHAWDMDPNAFYAEDEPVHRVRPFDRREAAQAEQLLFQKAVYDATRSIVASAPESAKFSRSTQSAISWLNSYETDVARKCFDRRLWAIMLPDFIASKPENEHGMRELKSQFTIASLLPYGNPVDQAQVWIGAKQRFLELFSSVVDDFELTEEAMNLKQRAGQRATDFASIWKNRYLDRGWNYEATKEKNAFVLALLPKTKAYILLLYKQGTLQPHTTFDHIVRCAESYSSEEPSLAARAAFNPQRYAGVKRRADTQTKSCLHCPHLSNHDTSECYKVRGRDRAPQVRHGQAPERHHGHHGHPPREHRQNPPPAAPAASAAPPRQSGTPGADRPKNFHDPRWKCDKCGKPAPGHYPSNCPQK